MLAELAVNSVQLTQKNTKTKTFRGIPVIGRSRKSKKEPERNLEDCDWVAYPKLRHIFTVITYIFRLKLNYCNHVPPFMRLWLACLLAGRG